MASKTTEKVKVVVRCRPMSPGEIQDGRQVVVQVNTQRGEIIVKNPKDPNEEPRTFTFDLAYDWNSQQETVYQETAYPIVESVLEGYNGTIFAYGQTGTGKTFTMEGKLDHPQYRGIIPRTFEHIFKFIEAAGKSKQFLVRASFLELYNEEIRDLLQKNFENKLDLREKPEGGFAVKDLSAYMIESPEELLDKLILGQKSRKVGETKMNKGSSRSHSIFMITVEASEIGVDGKQHITVGKLNLVDLAGSERQSKTEATGDRQKEGIYINQSLTALGNVISSLVDPKSTHIPYRDSKLTRLLMDSLGGNTKTVMIANFGPADYNFDETLSTLRYANRAKNIKNKPKINEDPKDAMLRQFQEEIARLKAQLAAAGGGQAIGGGEGEEQEMVVEKIVKVADEEKISKMEEDLEKEKAELVKWAEEERRKIEQAKNLAEGEREKLLRELQEKEESERKAMENQTKLLKKLKKMEDKLLVGNQAVEKAAEKAAELRRAEKEIEARRAREAKLAEEKAAQEDNIVQIENKFSSLKEEIEDKTKKLKKIYGKVQKMKEELRDEQEEWAREKDILTSEMREYERELKLKMLIIERFIPLSILQRIEEHAMFNEELDEWILPNMHLSGNAVRAARGDDPEEAARQAAQDKEDEMAVLAFEGHPNVFFVYTEEGPIRAELQSPKEKTKRVKTALKKPGSARPKKEASGESSKRSTQSTMNEENFPKARGLVKKNTQA